VGDVLVVGLVNDDEVVKNKGTPPVMPEQERYLALSGCKFVDEVIRDAPYDLTEEWVNKLVNEHQIDYIVHGDDPCITADGKDAYAYAKRIGKYKSIKRTEGVSTTDIVGRMLLMTREHHVVHHDETPSGASGAGAGAGGSGSATAAEPVTTSRLERGMRTSSLGSLASLEEGGEGGGDASAAAAAAPRVPTPQPISTLPQVQSKFLPTARRIMQFADGKAPKADDTVVYIAGSFDMFNAGHIAALQAARKFGSFLLVGIHDDATVNGLRGHGLPILNLYERTLSLLSCKFVDEVIIGAPWEITDDLIKTMNISVVVRGSMSDATNAAGHEHLGWVYKEREMAAALERAYAVPKAMGLLKSFESPMPLTALDIIDRILAARATFQKRYEKKSKMEEDYYSKSKEFIQEA
jgi:ethanolamine-phosphate cytidylyltransferase